MQPDEREKIVLQKLLLTCMSAEAPSEELQSLIAELSDDELNRLSRLIRDAQEKQCRRDEK
jgi:hypothetical protein